MEISFQGNNFAVVLGIQQTTELCVIYPVLPVTQIILVVPQYLRSIKKIKINME